MQKRHLLASSVAKLLVSAMIKFPSLHLYVRSEFTQPNFWIWAFSPMITVKTKCCTLSDSLIIRPLSNLCQASDTVFVSIPDLGAVPIVIRNCVTFVHSAIVETSTFPHKIRFNVNVRRIGSYKLYKDGTLDPNKKTMRPYLIYEASGPGDYIFEWEYENGIYFARVVVVDTST